MVFSFFLFFKKWFKFYGAQQPPTTSIPLNNCRWMYCYWWWWILLAFYRIRLLVPDFYVFLFTFLRWYGGERASERVRARVRSCEFTRVSEEIHETHLIYCGKLFASLKNRNNNRTALRACSFWLCLHARVCVCERERERENLSALEIGTSIESILKWAEHRRHGLWYYVCAFERFSTCARIFYILL